MSQSLVEVTTDKGLEWFHDKSSKKVNIGEISIFPVSRSAGQDVLSR
jgi:hypothetical protein